MTQSGYEMKRSTIHMVETEEGVLPMFGFVAMKLCYITRPYNYDRQVIAYRQNTFLRISTGTITTKAYNKNSHNLVLPKLI